MKSFKLSTSLLLCVLLFAQLVSSDLGVNYNNNSYEQTAAAAGPLSDNSKPNYEDFDDEPVWTGENNGADQQKLDGMDTMTTGTEEQSSARGGVGNAMEEENMEGSDYNDSFSEVVDEPTLNEESAYETVPFESEPINSLPDSGYSSPKYEETPELNEFGAGETSFSGSNGFGESLNSDALTGQQYLGNEQTVVQEKASAPASPPASPLIAPTAPAALPKTKPSKKERKAAKALAAGKPKGPNHTPATTGLNKSKKDKKAKKPAAHDKKSAAPKGKAAPPKGKAAPPKGKGAPAKGKAAPAKGKGASQKGKAVPKKGAKTQKKEAKKGGAKKV